MLNTLNVPLSQLKGGDVSVLATVSGEEIRPEVVREPALSPVTVSGRLSEASGQYLFQGRVSGLYLHTCDRCLDPAELPFDIEVAWVFVEGPRRDEPDPAEDDADELDEDAFEDEGFIAFEGTAIDLRAPVWDEIVLASPRKYLCCEDCRGLCPVCGTNLNRTSCSCSQTDSMENTGLAGLADMLADLKPKPSKEQDRAGTEA